MIIISGKFILDNNIEYSSIENKNIRDPDAWIKKYLIILSVDNLFLSEKIIGINIIMLISSPIHMIIHDEDESTIAVLKSKKINLIKMDGLIIYFLC
jgi:hypothetical protein